MKHILWCFLLLLVLEGAAQTTEVSDDKISTASGNPYLFKDWLDGVVIFKSGRVVKQFKLRFDCARNRLMLQFDGASFAAESQVKEFVLYTGGRKSKDSMVFRKGFPAIDKYTEDTYYQMLTSGKAVLLHLHAKVIVEEKQLVGNNNRNSLADEALYYLFQDGVMTGLPKDKDELVQKLRVQQDGLKQFVAQQTFRMDKAEDFVKIITKYNELLQ